jgi:hypothetical protein
MKKRTMIILVIILVLLIVMFMFTTQLRNHILGTQAIGRFMNFTGQTVVTSGSSDQIPETTNNTVFTENM